MYLSEGNSFEIIFKAERINYSNPKWYSSQYPDHAGELIENSDLDVLSSSIDIESYDPDTDYYTTFDTDGDEESITLGMDYYEISIVGHSKNAYFNVDNIGTCANLEDMTFTYDYAADKFYYGFCVHDNCPVYYEEATFQIPSIHQQQLLIL